MESDPVKVPETPLNICHWSLPLSLVVKIYYTEVLDAGSSASGEELWLVKAANLVSSPGTSQGVWVQTRFEKGSILRALCSKGFSNILLIKHRYNHLRDFKNLEAQCPPSPEQLSQNP